MHFIGFKYIKVSCVLMKIKPLSQKKKSRVKKGLFLLMLLDVDFSLFQ